MSDHLSSIHGPGDLKRLSFRELDELAEEIRKVIIETTARNGGHLAPNLGVVELTIALHRCFDSPHDRIVWDVSHQCYTHKLLTGRREQFATLRQHGGLSGFCWPPESPHDAFAAGHGSTAISAALGLATARDRRKEKHAVVAVVGDGALTGGVALEGLNQAGHLGTNLLVVLNDNEMSIRRNVGAMADYLRKARSDPTYLRAREEFEALMRLLPLGEAMIDLVGRVKDGVKRLIVPGMLFEDLGFTYLGPLDGHAVRDLCDAFGQAAHLSGPVLVHVRTQKGRGYRPAEREPARWHGTTPFDVETGARVPEPDLPRYTDAFAEAAVELAAKDERIVGITAAMADGTGMETLAERFPERCFDVGMAEQHAVTFAAGLARAGMRPLVAIYSTFLQRAYDQVVHDVCLQGLPVVFCLDRAGIVGDDGPTHHGVLDIAYLRSIPQLTVMAPADAAELRLALRLAFALDGPAAIRYPRGEAPSVWADESAPPFELGRAATCRTGTDCTILALGSTVAPALEAADALAGEGLSVQVVNSRFVKPLDVAALARSAFESGRVVTVEEGVLAGGFGSAVLEALADRGAAALKVERLGLPDAFVEHGDTQALRAQCGIDAEGIADAVRRVCSPAGRSRSKLKQGEIHS